jgi:hypothetical protein
VRRLRDLAFVAAGAIVACGVAAPRSATPESAPFESAPLESAPFESAPFELAVWPNDSTVEVRMTPVFVAQFDTVVAETRATRTEQAWCVSDVLVQREHGRRVLTLSRMARSPNVSRADSLHIWASRRLCEDDYAPGVHSHIVENTLLNFPSDTDLESAAARAAPFNLLVSAGVGRVPRLTVYALRAGLPQ